MKLESPASAKEIAQLHAAVEKACPILNLLINPQEIRGIVQHVHSGEPALAGAAD